LKASSGGLDEKQKDILRIYLARLVFSAYHVNARFKYSVSFFN
jgi:hypothetical protein